MGRRANTYIRAPDKKDNTGSSEASSQAQTSTAAAAAGQYLPGGSMYQKDLGSNAANPRGNTPVAQWLQEWEEKWNASNDKSEPNSKHSRSMLAILPALTDLQRNPSNAAEKLYRSGERGLRQDVNEEHWMSSYF